MAAPQFRPNEYIRYLQMSQRRHLLVEGPSDAHAYRCLAPVIVGKTTRFEYDTADQLLEVFDATSGSPLGNSAKVEQVAQQICQTGGINNFAAISDRMLRNFDIGATPIYDHGRPLGVCSQHWFTHGHSVENYMFDGQSMNSAVHTFCPGECIERASAIMAANCGTILEIAAALTLLAHEGLLAGTIPNYRVLFSFASGGGLVFSGGSFSITPAALEAQLVNKYGFAQSAAQNLSARLQHWLSVATATPGSTLLWVAHGHLLVNCILSAIAQCVESLDPIEGPRWSRKVSSTPPHIRENVLINEWIRTVANGGGAYPTEAFVFLAA